MDVLKGIGIILVVVGHVYSNETIYAWMHTFRMPIFFFAGGWLYKQKPIRTDIKRRFQTLVIPYFSFGLLVLLYWQFIERHFRDVDDTFIEALLGLFYGGYDHLTFNVHIWFLPCFFVTTVLINILVNVGGKKLAYIVAAALSVIYIVSCIDAVPSLPGLPWGLDRMCWYIGFYVIGMILAGVRVDIKITAQKKWLQIAEAVVLLGICFLISYIIGGEGIIFYIAEIIGLAGMVIIAIFIDHCRWLEYAGRISLVVLCIHGPVYRVVIKIVSLISGLDSDVVRANIILALIIVAVTMCICAAIYEVILRILPWMIGKRRTEI